MQWQRKQNINLQNQTLIVPFYVAKLCDSRPIIMQYLVEMESDAMILYLRNIWQILAKVLNKMDLWDTIAMFDTADI